MEYGMIVKKGFPFARVIRLRVLTLPNKELPVDEIIRNDELKEVARTMVELYKRSQCCESTTNIERYLYQDELM